MKRGKMSKDPNRLIWFLAYDAHNKRVVKAKRKETGQAGVYLIRENGSLVYIGLGRTCVYKSCYRHFYRWYDKRGIIRVTYKDLLEKKKYEIAFILTASVQETEELEKELICKYQPRDNKEKHEDYLIKKPESEEVPF